MELPNGWEVGYQREGGREGEKEEGREREGIHIWASSLSSGLKALNWRREW